MHNRGRRILAAALVASLLPWAVRAAPSGPAAPVEPELLARLAAGPADYIVHMALHADLSAAFGMDWAARGRYVLDALAEVAAAAQAPVLAACRERGLACRSLLAANAVAVRGGSLAVARDLAALPGVAQVRLARERPLVGDPAPRGEQAIVTWGLSDTRAPEVWALGARGAGVRVATIDTGVAWTHPALQPNYGCPDDPGDPRCWYDPASVCGGVPCDNQGHGTHVTGTAVAVDDPGLLYTAGMAPEATWIACKGCESASCSDSSLLACGDWVLAPGGDPAARPHVVTGGWGGAGADPWYRQVLVAWLAAGLFPSFAAGGGGPSCASLGSPCDYPEAFCTTAHGPDRIAAGFAGRGPGGFGDQPYTKPNLSAPGVNTCSSLPPDGWSCWSGTSTAAPHTSGAVALAVSACPELAYDPLALFDLLQSTADPPPAGACGAPPGGGNYTYGYGHLNALAAVQACSTQALHLNRLKVAGRLGLPGVYKAVALARVHDQAHAPAAGVAVLGEWTYPDGQPQPASGLTDALGRAKLRARSALPGVYRVCITGLAAPGYLYDPAADEWAACGSVTVGP